MERQFLFAAFVLEGLCFIRFTCILAKQVSLTSCWAALQQFHSWPQRCKKLRWIVYKGDLVEKAATELQVSVSHHFLWVYTILSMGVVYSIQHNMILERPRWMSPFQSWALLAAFGLFTIYVFFPRLVNARTLDAWFVFAMACTLVALTPWYTPKSQLLDVALTVFIFVRLPLLILSTRVLLSFLCNICFAILTTYRAYSEDIALEGTFGSAYQLLWIECGTCAITVGTSLALRWMLTRKVELKMQTANAEMQFNAASTLLGLVCDAVVELDSDFRLTMGSRTLAAMLLKAGDIAGTSVLSFMPADDAEHAAEHFRNFEPASGMPLAHAFHTHLIDSCSTRLPTEVFQVKYTKVNGQQCHLVGLREFSDKRQAGDHFQTDLRESKSSAESVEEVRIQVEDFKALKMRAGLATLDIEIASMHVVAASSALDHCVGMHVDELVPAHMAYLFDRLKQEIEKGNESRRTFSFDDMPLLGVEITGTMQVAWHRQRPHIIMAFKWPKEEGESPRVARLASLMSHASL